MGEPALVAAPVQFAITAAPARSAPITASNGARVILVPAPGPQGPPGPPGTGTEVFDETPTGLVNGINVVFTTAHAFQTASTRVFLNGLRERLGVGYTETNSTTITFSQPPATGDELVTDYLMA